MKITTWNVNGIRAAHKKGFLRWLKKDKSDIVCLQEIKAKKNQLPKKILNLKQYEIIVCDANRPGYAGTMVLTKNRPKPIKEKINYKKFNKEGRIVALNYVNFTLINLYMPHGARDKSKLGHKLKSYEELFLFINKLKNKNIILAGDFNIAHKEIDLARPKHNKNNIMFTPEERERITKLHSLGFVDTYRKLHPQGKKYTWWPYFANARTRNLGWRIDYIFVTHQLIKKLKSAKILTKITGSDHCPANIEIDI